MDPTSHSIDSTLPSTSIAPSGRCWAIKLGGSLLNLPGLADRLRVMISQISTKPLLVVGGGSSADCVREWDQIHSLGSSSAHWLAIRAMEFNQHLVESLLPEAASVSSFEEANAVWKRNGIALLNAFGWLKSQEGRPDSLPHSWDVTSDSIAASAALEFAAAGLVLLKSTDVPYGFPAVEASGEDVVDRYFARLAARLPQIVWWNLRTFDATKKRVP